MSLPDWHPRLFKRAYSVAELIADGVVHAGALVAGAIAFTILFIRVRMHGGVGDGVAMAVYAVGFFLMFGFSFAYNMTPASPAKWFLRRCDHAGIFLMIAGTYTALLSQIPDSAWTIALAAFVWTGALIGVVLNLAFPGRFDRVAVGVYLALGWSAVVTIRPLAASLPTLTLALVAVGGVIYSIGVAFYRWHSLKFQNAIWHGCVALAAGCQFAGIFAAVG